MGIFRKGASETGKLATQHDNRGLGEFEKGFRAAGGNTRLGWRPIRIRVTTQAAPAGSALVIVAVARWRGSPGIRGHCNSIGVRMPLILSRAENDSLNGARKEPLLLGERIGELDSDRMRMVLIFVDEHDGPLPIGTLDGVGCDH